MPRVRGRFEKIQKELGKMFFYKWLFIRQYIIPPYPPPSGPDFQTTSIDHPVVFLNPGQEKKEYEHKSNIFQYKICYFFPLFCYPDKLRVYPQAGLGISSF